MRCSKQLSIKIKMSRDLRPRIAKMMKKFKRRHFLIGRQLSNTSCKRMLTRLLMMI